MSYIERIRRFRQASKSDQRAAIKATLRTVFDSEARRLYGFLTGANAPPRVLRSNEKMYVAYRPDSDVLFNRHPELGLLSENWISRNLKNNAGDLPRLYSFILNIKQIIDENIPGDMAELGVFRGNSAASLAHYARASHKNVFLFDTFEGFDTRDLTGVDQAKGVEFADTSLDEVRALVGDENVTYVKGRFPESIPPDLYSKQFCIAHIDCDLYEPGKAGLEFFYPRLAPGGLLIVHDYGNPFWDGMKRAVDEYCRTIPERPLVFGDKSGTAMIRKSVA